MATLVRDLISNDAVHNNFLNEVFPIPGCNAYTTVNTMHSCEPLLFIQKCYVFYKHL